MSDPISVVFIGKPNPEALRMLALDILKWESEKDQRSMELADGEPVELGNVLIHDGGRTEKFVGVMVKARRRVVVRDMDAVRTAG